MDTTINYDKPFQTYEQLLKIMEDRHIIINDKEFAIQALINTHIMVL